MIQENNFGDVVYIISPSFFTLSKIRRFEKMFKHKKALTIFTIVSFLIIGVISFSPGLKSASATDVILASVDWVTSKLQPINSKIATLEKQINEQQKEIESLKAQLSNQHEDLPRVVFVSDDKTTIRSGADPKYKIVATYLKGTPLLVIDKFFSSTGLWYRVSLSPTLKGWVNSSQVSTNQIAPKTSLIIVTVHSTQLRRGASESYAVTLTLSKGQSLKYIQTFVNNSTNEVWYNVETSSGKRGWILATHGQVK